jgi:hypothetical protein
MNQIHKRNKSRDKNTSIAPQNNIKVENDKNQKAKLEHLENLLTKSKIINIKLTEEKNKLELELNTLHQTQSI